MDFEDQQDPFAVPNLWRPSILTIASDDDGLFPLPELDGQLSVRPFEVSPNHQQ